MLVLLITSKQNNIVYISGMAVKSGVEEIICLYHDTTAIRTLCLMIFPVNPDFHPATKTFFDLT